VITVEHPLLFVTSDYLAEISLLKAKKRLSLEALKALLREREAQGKAAEQWVLKYEQERLRATGCDIEAGAVRIISELDVAAGFDIESFDGLSPNLKADRLIEDEEHDGFRGVVHMVRE